MKRPSITRAEYAEIATFLIYGIVPEKWSTSASKKQTFTRRCKRFFLCSGHLAIKYKEDTKTVICVDDLERMEAIIKLNHQETHRGRDKTFYALCQEYVGISRTEVQNFILRCESCQLIDRLKRNRHYGLIQANLYGQDEDVQS